MHRQSHRRHALIAAVAAALGAGCLQEPDFESAYDLEVDLCAPERAAELQASIDACRQRYLADGSCAGVMSFTGLIDDVDVVVSGELDATIATHATESAGLSLESLVLEGRAPFFGFQMTFGDLGGLVSEPAVPRDLALDAVATPSLTDAATTLTFRITDGAASKQRQHRSGTASITLQQPTEVAGTFGAANFAGDLLNGCFHGFVTETRGP